MNTTTTQTTKNEYWTKRNALVDAALALTPTCDELTGPQTARAASYCEALEALAAFDRDHGGAPIL